MGPDHVLDPRGEVILVVRNPNAPFAVWRPPAPSSSEDTSPATSITLSSPKSEETSNDETQTVLETAAGDTKDKDGPVPTLTLGSPASDRMLKGNWNEGHELRGNGFIELVVEGWDVKALLVVFYVLHSDHWKIPRVVNVELLAKIAVIADYYNFDLDEARISIIRKDVCSIYGYRDSFIADTQDLEDFESSESRSKSTMLSFVMRLLKSLNFGLSKPEPSYPGVTFAEVRREGGGVAERLEAEFRRTYNLGEPS
ncbi:uncharacterized protein BDV17DRAFT_288690 [Aspergillus undulatus]|uniref:uncharacterized protein n=1 Tax=Aspergillus undulatus TaxID=1810928 RepID=UPI003CCCE9AD